MNNRVIELFGFILIFSAIGLFSAIITYSPNDPNFLYNIDNSNINNILGLKGSIVSDFFLQSIGLISIILSINFFIWGFKLLRKKIINNFISKIFYTVIYILSGTTLIYIYNNTSYWLIDNGNSGFLGRIIGENLQILTGLDQNLYFIIVLLVLTVVFFFIKC